VEGVWPDSDSFLYFKPGRVWAVYEGPKIREETIDRTPFLRRGTLMVPLHVIAQDWKYDFSLEWNPRTVTANLIIDHQRGVWFYRLEMEKARRSRPKIAIDGREVTLSPAPVIRDGRLYVPAQQVFGALGLVVKTGNRSGQITVIWPDTEDAIFFEPGRVWVVDDSGVPMREQTLDKTPFMLRDALMAPLRVVAREWRYALYVEWHSKTRTANIHVIPRKDVPPLLPPPDAKPRAKSGSG
jgi:hypothetical protein